MAVEIGSHHAGDVHAAAAELRDVVGNGVAMAEAVPHAFGLVIAAQGSAWQAILGAVNGGNDSDTIAMIAGAIAAAYEPVDSWPPGILDEIERQNGLDLTAFAAEFVAAIASEPV
ncbi:ADP-ribosylglycohydrolase family protein [Pleomorphomonas sp. PLEO]|uniref:ADP-ribosylglycohydrolase family protein n=1 Tax=Pleomorphomonas sp. PLEO TaxID=3239306 RepID=UPI00351EF85D